MSEETATNQAEAADTSLDTGGNEAGVEAEGQQPELDEFGEPIIPAVEDEEIELDDLKLKVPKDQAQKVREAMLRQADYTRKTQEVADLRKAVEAERQTLHQASQAEIGALAQVSAIDQQLAEFHKVDWDAWENDDPFAAQKAWRQFQTLQQQRGQAVNQYVGLQRQRTLETQRETARLIEDGQKVLARDIKGWGPELASSLLGTGVKQYGFDKAELEEAITDPRLMKVLHDAHQFHVLQGKQKTANTIPTEQGVRPAAKVGGGSAPPQGLDDRLSAEEWTRRRNAQVRKRGRG